MHMLSVYLQSLHKTPLKTSVWMSMKIPYPPLSVWMGSPNTDVPHLIAIPSFVLSLLFSLAYPLNLFTFPSLFLSLSVCPRHLLTSLSYLVSPLSLSPYPLPLLFFSSPPLSLCLSLFLCLSLSLCLSVSVSLSLCLSLSLSLSLSQGRIWDDPEWVWRWIKTQFTHLKAQTKCAFQTVISLGTFLHPLKWVWAWVEHRLTEALLLIVKDEWWRFSAWLPLTCEWFNLFCRACLRLSCVEQLGRVNAPEPLQCYQILGIYMQSTRERASERASERGIVEAPNPDLLLKAMCLYSLSVILG